MGKTFKRNRSEYDVEYSRKWSKMSRKNRSKRKVNDFYSPVHERYEDDEW